MGDVLLHDHKLKNNQPLRTMVLSWHSCPLTFSALNTVMFMFHFYPVLSLSCCLKQASKHSLFWLEARERPHFTMTYCPRQPLPGIQSSKETLESTACATAIRKTSTNLQQPQGRQPQIKLQFPPHTVKRRPFLKILMPEPNFLPAGRFYKAMKLPRSLKLLLCIMTRMPALVLQWFLHSCFFHIHTHKPRHKPHLPTGGGVHMHLPHIFLAWKVKLHVFYLILVLTTSSLVEHASSNISTCSKRQLPYLGVVPKLVRIPLVSVR